MPIAKTPAPASQQARGASALAQLRGLGPASAQMLMSAGIHSADELRRANLYALYARIKKTQPKVSINLLYAMMGAVENQDWRVISRERRSEVLMRLDDLGLL
jgi:DNA transformation protein and related proteins